MTTQEFSNQFDTLISAYSKSTSDLFAFDEYEKSVFLTEAQEEIVIELYNGKNNFGESFESTEELRRLLSNLLKTVVLNPQDIENENIAKDSIFFSVPKDVMFITYESVTFEDTNEECIKGTEAVVVPVAQDDFHKVKKNPFKGPNKNRVLRLDYNSNIVELVSKYSIANYFIKYLSRPNPIILVNLGDLSINGINEITECELNPVLHRIILERAIRKAITSRIPAGNQKE